MLERLDTIFLGGELCLRKDVSVQEITGYVQDLYDYGMRLIRVYPYWAHIEEERGKFRLEAYDACFREAEKLGMSIVFTFKPNSPPWWMGVTKSYNLDDYPHIDEPEYWDAFLEYVRTIVRRYKDSSALLAWCVWNEPRITIPQNMKEGMLAQYWSFLQRYYENDIERLKEKYFYQYASFSDVKPLENSGSVAGRQDMPEQMDFYRFCTSTLARKLKSISDTIKEIDPIHFTHINTHNTEQQSVILSHNIWKESEAVDFVGTSNYPHYDFTFPDSFRMNGFSCALMRSATRDPEKRFWITEMQGGPAMYTGHTSGISVPEPADLKLALWDYIGGGAKGCIYWSFTPTVRGEWQLCGFGKKPTSRMQATYEVFQIIEKNRELLENASPAEPDVWILSSEASLIHDTLLGRENNYKSPFDKYAHAHAQIGAYTILSDLGYSVGMINETRFDQGEIPSGSYLVVPGCTCVSKKTMRNLAEFVKNGGTLIADAFFGWKDEYAQVDPECHQIADEIFGSAWLDFGDIRPTTKIIDKNGDSVYPAWFMRDILDCGPNTICTYDTGEGAASLAHYGQGTALRFGTDVFRLSLFEDIQGAIDIISRVLPKNRNNGIWLKKGGNGLRLHVQKSEDKLVLFIVNYSSEERELQFEGEFPKTGMDLNNGNEEELDGMVIQGRSVKLLALEGN